MTTTAVSPVSHVSPRIQDQTRLRSMWFRVAHGTLRNPGGMIGTLMFGFMVLMALSAPVIAPRDPVRQDITHRLQPPAWVSEKGTTLLGTDQVGRDMASRLFFGARVSLSLSLLVVVLASTLGVALGLTAGLQRGWLEVIIMRIADSLLAVPFMVVAIAIIAVWGTGWLQLVALLTAFVWVPFTRMVRADMLSAREGLRGGRALPGRRWRTHCGTPRAAKRHVAGHRACHVHDRSADHCRERALVPGGRHPATHSQLGLDAERWARLMDTGWWLSVFPGLAISLTVMGANFMGDALRDVLDPRQRL